MTSRLLPLLAGLVLGAGGAWVVRQQTRSAGPGHAAARPSDIAHQPSSIPLVLAPRLAGPEADAALDAYLALPPLDAQASSAAIAERSLRLRALLTLLPNSSFDRLFAALALRLGPAEARLRRLAFDVWTERDAPAAARWAAALVPNDAINAAGRDRYATQAAGAWSRNDFDAAFAWASTLPDARLGRTVSSDLLGRLAATDPARALALARAGGEEFFAAVQGSIFKAWSAKNPSAAVQALGASLMAENPGNAWRVTEVLSKWAVDDPRAAFAWLDTQSGLAPEAIGSTIWSLVNQISRSDIKASLRPFADALTARALAGEGQRPLADLLRAWAASDSSGALAWLDSIPDAALRNDLLVQATGEFRSNRPETNLPLALHLPPGPARDNALAKTVGRWAEQDPDAALAWLREHDDPSLAAVAAQVQGRLLGKLAAADPAAALARWESLPADESRIGAAPGIAKAWAETDPAAAARWLSNQFPELPNMTFKDMEKLSPQAMADLQQKYMLYEGHFETLFKVAADWSRKDPAGLITWAESLPAPLLQESILNSLGQNSRYNDEVPDRSVLASQLSAITDPALRDRVLGEHLQTWLRFDVKAARDWIDSHDALSPEKAAELLTQAAANP